MPSYTPTVLIGIDSLQNLVVLNVNVQAPLKLIATNYFACRLQFTSILFGYDLLGFVNGSKQCPSATITLPDATSLSPNPDYTLWLNAIIVSVSPALVQFLSTSTTSRVALTTFEKTHASPPRRRIMVNCQNLASPQQGTRTIT